MSDKPLFNESDIIFTYTRADALSDGVLIELTPLAIEAGFKLPVAITAAAWSAAIESPADCPEQSEMGRAWDVLNVLLWKARQCGEAIWLNITVSVQNSPTSSENIHLKALIHPGDSGEPVITIMLPHED